MTEPETYIPLAEQLFDEAVASHAVTVVGQTEDGRVLYEQPDTLPRETGLQQ